MIINILIGVLIGLGISAIVAGISIKRDNERVERREKLYDQILILERRKHFIMSEIRLNLIGVLDGVYNILYQVKNGDTSNVEDTLQHLNRLLDMPDTYDDFEHSGEYKRVMLERDNDQNKYLKTKQEYEDHYGENFE
jgi:hypothetical protein